MAGIPPLSGFWAKLILIKAGLDAGQYLIVAAALAVSLLTLTFCLLVALARRRGYLAAWSCHRLAIVRLPTRALRWLIVDE